MSLRNQEIAEVFNEWLGRFTVPRHLQPEDKAGARQAEADALLRAFITALPSQGWRDPMQRAFDRLGQVMKTRNWPIEAEIRSAVFEVMTDIRQKQARASNAMADNPHDEAALAMLTDWFRKFRSEMPQMGSAYRTRKLIERAVITLEEARSCGFTMDDDTARKAREAAARSMEGFTDG